MVENESENDEEAARRSDDQAGLELSGSGVLTLERGRGLGATWEIEPRSPRGI